MHLLLFFLQTISWLVVNLPRGYYRHNSLSLHRSFVFGCRDRQNAVRRQTGHHINSEMVPGKRVLPHEMTGDRRAMVVCFILVLPFHYYLIPSSFDRDLVGGELVHVNAYLKLVPVCCNMVAATRANKGARTRTTREHCRGHRPVRNYNLRISGVKRIHCVKL